MAVSKNLKKAVNVKGLRRLGLIGFANPSLC
jgi:hypothetical protein